MNDNINIYQYWGQGYGNMPDFLQYIYITNKEICEKYNINLILLDDININNYITLHKRYNNLAYNFKSDYIRYNILNKYGGFWFDTDVIITKDLNKLYNKIKNYECMLDIEFNNKIGCCSLFIKKDSTVSNYCMNRVNNILNTKEHLDWEDIGPETVEDLYKKHKSLIYLNDYNTVKKGCNIICWNDNPGHNKDKWYLKTEQDAENKAKLLQNNEDCYYIITWTIYREHNMGDNLNNMVFNDKKSIFSYFINYKKERFIVKNCKDKEWNGEYIKSNMQHDNIIYKKDDKHHLYKYNNVWRLGEYSIKLYTTLSNTIDFNIDFNNKKYNKYAVLWTSTINIGDDIQTLAAINFLKKKGITEYTFIDREKLSDYNGDPVTLIMNSWYMHNINKFPPSNKIKPVFISVHISKENMISNNINYFKKYQPIGCRDKATVNLFKKYNIDAYFTGCLTLLFDDVKEKTGGKYIVDVNTKCDYIPNIKLNTTKYNDYQIIEHDINYSNFKNKKKYLICIISCNKKKNFKEWIKKYWLNNFISNTDNIDYLFIYGNINQNKDYELKGDELHLKCDDGYFKLNEKMYYLWNYLAKEHSKKYDFYIKCDDDNYINSLKFYKLLNDTQHLTSYGCYNNNITEGKWNGLPTGDWQGPFWEGPINWFNQDILQYYCNNIKYDDLKKTRVEDKLFSDTIRGCPNSTEIKIYKGNNLFLNGWPHYDNIKHSNFNGDINISDYNNNVIFSNIKVENDFKFLAKCFTSNKTFNTHFIEVKDRLIMAEDLLNKYRNAEQVITTRLHCALPCRAFNTDCIFIHNNYNNDPRFTGLKNIINGDINIHDKTNGDRNEIENIRKNFLLLKI